MAPMNTWTLFAGGVVFLLAVDITPGCPVVLPPTCGPPVPASVPVAAVKSGEELNLPLRRRLGVSVCRCSMRAWTSVDAAWVDVWRCKRTSSPSEWIDGDEVDGTRWPRTGDARSAVPLVDRGTWRETYSVIFIAISRCQS